MTRRSGTGIRSWLLVALVLAMCLGTATLAFVLTPAEYSTQATALLAAPSPQVGTDGVTVNPYGNVAASTSRLAELLARLGNGDAARAATRAGGGTASFAVTADAQIPVLTVRATGRHPSDVARTAELASVQLSREITQLQSGTGIASAEQFTLRSISSPSTATRDDDTAAVVAALVFAVCLAAAAGVFVLRRLRSDRHRATGSLPRTPRLRTPLRGQTEVRRPATLSGAHSASTEGPAVGRQRWIAPVDDTYTELSPSPLRALRRSDRDVVAPPKPIFGDLFDDDAGPEETDVAEADGSVTAEPGPETAGEPDPVADEPLGTAEPETDVEPPAADSPAAMIDLTEPVGPVADEEPAAVVDDGAPPPDSTTHSVPDSTTDSVPDSTTDSVPDEPVITAVGYEGRADPLAGNVAGRARRTLPREDALAEEAARAYDERFSAAAVEALRVPSRRAPSGVEPLLADPTDSYAGGPDSAGLMDHEARRELHSVATTLLPVPLDPALVAELETQLEVELEADVLAEPVDSAPAPQLRAAPEPAAEASGPSAAKPAPKKSTQQRGKRTSTRPTSGAEGRVKTATRAENGGAVATLRASGTSRHQKPTTRSRKPATQASGNDVSARDGDDRPWAPNGSAPTSAQAGRDDADGSAPEVTELRGEN